MDSYERLRRDASPPTFDEFDVPELVRRWFYVAMGRWIEDGAHGLWMEPESEDGHCNPHQLAYTIGERMSALSDLYNGGRAESPIEEMLLGPLLWIACDWAGFPKADMVGGPEDQIHSFGGYESGVAFYLTPQAEIAGYRVDFLLWFISKKNVAGVAVECDGHNFHEKTKEQAARDKSRDRALLTAGFPVMRFTGSEIYAAPLKCAEQVREALNEPLNRVSRLGGLFA